MKDTKVKLPTKEMILKTAESCSTAKAALMKLFPNVFKEENKHDRIKTIDDVFEECGITNYKKVIKSIQDNDYLSDDKKRHDIADYICEHIALAFNEEKAEDWQDWKEGNIQSKYTGYFYMDGGRFRLDDVGDYSYYSSAGTGARFFMKKKEDFEYVGKQFVQYYKDLNL